MEPFSSRRQRPRASAQTNDVFRRDDDGDDRKNGGLGSSPEGIGTEREEGRDRELVFGMHRWEDENTPFAVVIAKGRDLDKGA